MYRFKIKIAFPAQKKSCFYGIIYTILNIACSGVRALCPSSHIQAHIRIPDTAKVIGWIIRDGWAE